MYFSYFSSNVCHSSFSLQKEFQQCEDEDEYDVVIRRCSHKIIITGRFFFGMFHQFLFVITDENLLPLDFFRLVVNNLIFFRDVTQKIIGNFFHSTQLQFVLIVVGLLDAVHCRMYVTGHSLIAYVYSQMIYFNYNKSIFFQVTCMPI